MLFAVAVAVGGPRTHAQLRGATLIRGAASRQTSLLVTHNVTGRAAQFQG